MSKTISKKLMYVVLVMAMLAMMIPMAIPVSAQAEPALAMYLLAPVGPNPAAPSVDNLTAETNPGFNITGSTVRVVPVNLGNLTVDNWTVNNYPAVNAQAQIVNSAPGAQGVAFADVNGTVGVASIVAYLSDGSHIDIDKKWAQIYETRITAAQSVPVLWQENLKVWTATATVSDLVVGLFTDKDGNPELTTPVTSPAGQEPLTGVILHWYLINGNTVSSIPMAQGYYSALNTTMLGLATPIKTTIVGGDNPTDTVTVTGVNGTNSITLSNIGGEPVWVVVVPEYPSTSNVLVTPEVTSVNFWISEAVVVPQVRWVGEKIVLEKFFGTEYAGNLVHFAVNKQNTALEGLEGSQMGNLNNTTTSVWDVVSTTGWARCMLVSQDTGKVVVNLALYNTGDGAGIPGDSKIANQHEFDVFYMKLESITLGNVVGKRVGHNSGTFDPSNPVWDIGNTYPDLPGNLTPDEPSGILNVSQDTLLRARVKGWFMGDIPSTRAYKVQDADLTNPGHYLYGLPAGRWVLPDDWAILAGPGEEAALQWDIMNNPGDGLSGVTDKMSGAVTPGVGNYTLGTVLKAQAPVIGPFAPELERTLANGTYDPNISIYGYRYGVTPAVGGYPVLARKTVVPNGQLNWWDAPMPSAKITFKIQNVSAFPDNSTIQIGNAGFFKEAVKSDIYFLMRGAVKEYTNPFYYAMIPSNFEIPAFVNNGGYDWDSWNVNYGPYQFWHIINRLPNKSLPVTSPVRNDSLVPAQVQVYSDNHGEAMVYLNGNYNLNSLLFTFKGLDIPFGSTVGSTTVTAMADYPYFRTDNQLKSATVTKTWTWGGMITGPTESNHQMILSVGDYTATSATDGNSRDKMVWVWATDRDGLQDGVMGTQVDWTIQPVGTTTAIIPDLTTLSTDVPPGVSQFNDTMKHINITHGFLDNTMGGIVNTPAGPVYRSWMRAPTTYEKDLFNKFWGATGSDPIIGADGHAVDPDNFVVAAIDLYDSTGTADVTVGAFLQSADFGTIHYTWNVNFAVAHPLDDVAIAGDANNDGYVTMADVTAIERIILGMDPACYQADSNSNGVINMGDVVKAERFILGAE